MPLFLNGWGWYLAGVLLYFVVAAGALVLIRRLLRPPGEQAVPWSGFELLGVALLYFFWPIFFATLLATTGIGQWLCDPAMLEAARAADPSPGQQLDRLRFSLRVLLLAFPFQALSVPVLLRRVSGTRPDQFGLTTRDAGQNLLLAVLFIAVVAPVVLAINHLVEIAYKHWFPETVQPHPFSRIGVEGSALDLVLIGVLAIVAAPVVEELIFRGVFQPWFAGREWGGHLAMAFALARVLPYPGEKLRHLLEGTTAERVRVLSPPLFVLLMVLPYLWVWRKQRTFLPSALFGTSMLFAMIHVEVWPSPIALFPLALALGWLAWRTRSLVGPIVAHALFNAIAFWQLLRMGK